MDCASDDQVRAFVNIMLDHCFTVHDITLIETPDKCILRMPQIKLKTFKDIAFPVIVFDPDSRVTREIKCLEPHEMFCAVKAQASSVTSS